MQIGGGIPYPAIAIEDVGNSGGIDRESSLVPRSIDIVPDPLSILSANCCSSNSTTGYTAVGWAGIDERYEDTWRSVPERL